MELYRKLSDIPADFGPSVVTIGNFDGVHTGHARVLSTVAQLACEYGLVATAVSFDPHPARVHYPTVPLQEIMGQRDRQHFLEQLGIEAYVLIRYTLEFSHQSPEEFVKKTFVDSLNTRYVVVGDDVRFGENNSGDLATMQQLGKKYGFRVITVEDLMADASHRTSSTGIRELLSVGDVETAATLLGRPHRISGEVVHGAARGRTLGFPTANMAADADGFIPADGVYAGWLTDIMGQRHPVAISVGTNPTFTGDTRRQVEAHVIDRPQEPVEDFNLYGQSVILEFTRYLRDIVAYEGPELLIEQMNRDVVSVRKSLELSS